MKLSLKDTGSGAGMTLVVARCELKNIQSLATLLKYVTPGLTRGLSER